MRDNNSLSGARTRVRGTVRVGIGQARVDAIATRSSRRCGDEHIDDGTAPRMGVGSRLDADEVVAPEVRLRDVRHMRRALPMGLPPLGDPRYPSESREVLVSRRHLVWEQMRANAYLRLKLNQLCIAHYYPGCGHWKHHSTGDTNECACVEGIMEVKKKR